MVAVDLSAKVFNLAKDVPHYGQRFLSVSVRMRWICAR